MTQPTGESQPLLLTKSSSNHSTNTSSHNHICPTKFLNPTASAYTASDFFKEVSIGFVNSIICIPVLFGFTNIIYSHEFFVPFRSSLVQLLLWSSLLHQLTMTIFSSMNFSVCQVQDAGLLFLGAMATKIAESLLVAPECTPDPLFSAHCISSVLSTTIFTIGIATSLLGFALMLIAHKKLARLINYIALSVISAYLAYIGALLLTAGVSISTDYSLAVPHDIPRVFYKNFPYALLSATPAWFLAIILMFIVRRYPSGLTLPGCLIGIPLVFYTVAFSCGYSLQQLRDLSFVAQPNTGSSELFSHLSFHHVSPLHIPQVGVEWILMVLVVAFSSALDIVSIELELGKPLDINRELYSIGISNGLNGLLMGASGSYIFSQTIFTARCKPKSKLPGLTVVLIEGCVLFLSLDLSAYFPKIWFSTTLSFIAFELIWEWLIERRKKVQRDDWLITIFTFCAIIATNLQYGFFLGLLSALLHFVYTYSTTFSLGQSSFYESGNIHSSISPLVRPIIYHNESSNELLIPPPVCLRIRSYLKRNVIIISITGHLRFMTAPMLLEEIQTALTHHQQEHFELTNPLSTTNHNHTSNNSPYMSFEHSSIDQQISSADLDDFDPFNGASYQQEFELQQEHEKQLYIEKIKKHHQLLSQATSPTSYIRHLDSNDDNKNKPTGNNDPQLTTAELNLLVFNLQNESNSNSTGLTTPDLEKRYLSANYNEELLSHLNSTIILDFSSVLGLDSSALHTIKLAINACNQHNVDDIRPIDVSDDHDIDTKQHKLYIPRFDVLFVGLSDENLNLLARNNIGVFHAGESSHKSSTDDHNNHYLQSPQHDQPFLSISQASVDSTQSHPSPTLSSSSSTFSASSASIQAIQNVNRNNINLHDGPIRGSNKFHQAQSEVASIFNLDPHTSPSFHPPCNVVTGSNDIIVAHYQDIGDAKAWCAAKSYLIHTYNLPKP